jgi:hypothetical protein
VQSWSAVSQLRGTAFPRKHLVIRRQHTRAHDQQPSAHCSRVARPPACSCSSCQHQCAARPWRIGLSESQSAVCGPLFPTQPSRSCPAIAVRTNTAHSPPKRRPTTSTSTVERSFQRCAALLPRSSARPHPNTKCPVQCAVCSVPVSRPSHRVSGPFKSHTASFQQHGQRDSVAISLQTCSRGPVECPLDYMDPSSVLPPYCSIPLPAHRIERAPIIP